MSSGTCPCPAMDIQDGGVEGCVDNRQVNLGVQNEAGQGLTEFSQENEPVIGNTLFQQHKRCLHMDITRWLILKSD